MIRAVAEPEARPQQQQQKQHTPAEKAPAAQATSSSPSSSTSSRRPPRTKRVRVFTSPLRALLLLGLFALLIGLASLVVPTTLWVEGGGFVMTDVDAELRPSVEGNIDKWLVSTGQLVEKDQLVIQLNGSIQQAEHEEASSELRAKEAELDQMLSAQELERAQRKEQVSRGEQNLKLAEAYLERMTGGGYSQKEVDEARLKMEIALSQLAELRLPREDLMGKQVSVLRQQIESSRKKIASTEAQLKLREVRTPVAGIVQLHRFEVGEVVKPDHVLAQVFDQRDWVVKLKLPEESFGRVQVGQKVEVAVAAYPTMRYGYLKAKVIRIMPSVTPRQSGNGVYLVEASLEPPSDRPITPGMTVTGYVNGGRTNWLSRWMGW